MKRRLFFIAVGLLVTLGSHAQYMKSALGLRGGLGGGFSYQHFYQEDRDVKCLLTFRDNGIQLAVLMEHYKPAPVRFGDNIFFYYGMGVHIGITRDRAYRSKNNYDENFNFVAPISRAVIGADGIIGIEYRIYSIPVTFGMDYKPFFDLFGHRVFRLGLGDIGFTVKYVF